MSTPSDLSEWIYWARRDDWHEYFVGSNIRCMLGEIERLRVQLAQADAMLAQNARKIDRANRSNWPKGSYLEAALSRHEARVRIENASERT